MKLSTKGRYAMIALDRSRRPRAGAAGGLSEIADRQDISLAYLEQLFVKLRRAEIVESVRGPGGGYRLARPVGEIRILNPRGGRRDDGRAVRGAGASGGPGARASRRSPTSSGSSSRPTST